MDIKDDGEITNMTLRVDILNSSPYFSIDFHDIMEKLKINQDKLQKTYVVHIFLRTENADTHVLIKDLNYSLTFDNLAELIMNSNNDDPSEPAKLDIQSFSSPSDGSTRTQNVNIENEYFVQFVKKPLSSYCISNIHPINNHVQFNMNNLDDEIMINNIQLFDQNNIRYE